MITRTKIAIRAIPNSVLLRYRDRRLITMRYVLPTFIVAVVMLVLLQPNPPPPPPLDLWKQPTLLNLNFTWISNNENLCQPDFNASEHRHILPILISSSRSNFEKRRIIRQTWGSLRTYKNWEVRLVFLLGQSNFTEKGPAMEQLQDEENHLHDEQILYQDLVIGSFIDNYRNLSLKSLMGYKWILNFCREAQFIWKVDDDVFFDAMYWLDWLSDELEKVSIDENHTLPSLLCIPVNGYKPERSMSGPLAKWLVSYEEWPDRQYPNYCLGYAHSIQLDFMEKIYAVSNSRKMFWIDDVYVTGVLREAAEKTFNIAPKIKNIAGETKYQLKRMCKNGTFHDLQLKPIILILADIQWHMTCFWNKTINDREELYGRQLLKMHQ